MIDEIVQAVFDDGKTALRKKSVCIARGISYRLLPSQPLTPREKREQERERRDLETRTVAVEKILGKRGDSEERGLGNGKVHLSQKERESIERYIGVPVEDAQDARRKMKERGFRMMEKGEELDVRLKAQKEWVEAGGESSGVPLPAAAGFPGWDKLGVMRAPEKFNHEERLAHWKSVYGE